MNCCVGHLFCVWGICLYKLVGVPLTGFAALVEPCYMEGIMICALDIYVLSPNRGIAVSTDVCVSHMSVSRVLADPKFINLIFPPSPVVDLTSDKIDAFCSSPSTSLLPSSPSPITDIADEDRFLGNICGCNGMVGVFTCLSINCCVHLPLTSSLYAVTV